MSNFAIFVIILSVVAGVLGWRSGMLRQIGGIAGIILGIAACRIFGSTVATMLCGESASAGDKVMYTVLAYVLLFIVVYVLATLVARMLRKILEAVHIGILNRLAGAIFKIAEWILLLSLFLNLWQMISPIESLAGDAVYERVLWFGPYLLGTDAAAKVGNIVTTAIQG